MKSPAAYYFLLLYFAFACKPLTIVLSDVAAHFFFEHEHMVVHQKYGQNHVHNEIAKTANENAAGNKSVTVKMFDETSSYFPEQHDFPLLRYSSAIRHSSFILATLYNICMSIQLPPPKV